MNVFKMKDGDGHKAAKPQRYVIDPKTGKPVVHDGPNRAQNRAQW